MDEAWKIAKAVLEAEEAWNGCAGILSTESTRRWSERQHARFNAAIPLAKALLNLLDGCQRGPDTCYGCALWHGDCDAPCHAATEDGLTGNVTEADPPIARTMHPLADDDDVYCTECGRGIKRGATYWSKVPGKDGDICDACHEKYLWRQSR